MGLFKHKKDEEAKIQLEREALDRLNNNDLNYFDIDTFYTEDDWNLSGKVKAPHTITADELNHRNSAFNTINYITEEDDDDKGGDNSPTQFLYQRMMQFRAKASEPPEASEEKSENSIQSEEKTDNNIKIEEYEKDLSEDTVVTEATADNKPEAPVTTNTKPDLGGSAEQRRVTLLARCNAYLEDATEPYKVDTEKYKLESVESILESFEARAAERINKKFNINSPTSDSKESVIAPNVAAKSVNFSPALSDTVVFSAPPTKTADTTVLPDTSKTVAKHIFTADAPLAKSEINEFDDISSTRIISDISSHSKPAVSSNSAETTLFPAAKTVTGAPSAEMYSGLPAKTEEDEEPSFEDYKSIADRPKILKMLSSKKNSFSVKLIASFVCFIVSLLVLSPVSTAFSIAQGTANIIDLVVCFLILAINFEALGDIQFLFSAKAKTSLPAALSIISATLFSIINWAFKGSLSGLSTVVAVSLVSYNLANKNFYSKAIKNFNLIATSEFKNSVSIIQNKNATNAIVGSSIEGSALVCYGGETTNLHNFLKYTLCANPISGKIQKMSLISVIAALVLSATAFVFNSENFVFPLFVFCATICFFSIPSVYHIVSLTVNSANKRLNHYDAMITGYKAADELELCNAIALSSDELFPDGTIRLVDMKLLSPNPFDQSILDAAAIASAIHSPLAGIFKQMDTSKAYNTASQEVDTVIYEEKMGISGWVNDRRVFVGNRDLLIGHGFTGLPPAELDKKIMRKGYFPVYIASDNIPCALLVVKYEPDDDIVYEIQRLANTGTTVIVDNCDPNINAQMLTDYFGLYSETVFIMNKQGSTFFKASKEHKEHRKGGAVFKSRIEGLLATLTASINIKKYVTRMTAFYITGIVLGVLALLSCILTSLTAFVTPLIILLIQLALTAITLLPTVLRKP